MANNRMYLRHGSGQAIYIGKRMAWGWYNAPTREDMERFFEWLADNPCDDHDQDDFEIVLECRDRGATGNCRSEVEHDGSDYVATNITLLDDWAV